MAGLRGEMVPTAVNIAPVPPEVMEKVGPYIALAEDLGSHGRAARARRRRRSSTSLTVGGLAETDTRILKTAVLKGMLARVDRRGGQLRQRRLLRRAARHQGHRDEAAPRRTTT